MIGIYILSKNVAALVDFYKKAFRAETDGEGCHYVLRLPGGKESFVIWDNGEVTDTVNEKIALVLGVDDVDAEYEALAKMQATVLEPPVNNPWGRRHMVFCDPDGNRIRFVGPVKQV